MRNVGKLSEFMVPTRNDAQEVIDKMQSLIAENGYVTASEVFTMISVVPTDTDSDYGWATVNGVSVTAISGGYDGFKISFPYPKKLAIPASWTPPKPKQPKFDMNFLFMTSCWDPDDFKEFEAWNVSQYELRNDKDIPETDKHIPYPGWRRYSITTHCITYTVVAKLAKNGGWHIREYIAKDH